MIEQILMGASAVITLSACYVGWRFAKDAEGYYKALDLSREECDRQADIIARYQAKKPERDTNGKFTSKKARVTAELQAYVASKKAVS